MVGDDRKAIWPARPGLPPVLICSLLFWAACAATYSSSALRTVGECQCLALASAALAVPIAVMAAFRRFRFACLAVASIAVGMAFGFGQAASVIWNAESYSGAEEGLMTFEVLEDSREGNFGESMLVRGSIGGLPEATFSARSVADTPLFCGERFSCKVRVAPIDLGADSRAWGNGSCARVVVSDLGEMNVDSPLAPLRGFRRRAIDFIGSGSDASRLLQAVVCGYRRNVDGTQMYSEFQACGLAHLVAVSGAHLVIVTGFVATLLKWLRSPRRLTVVVLIAMMASYYVVAGMPVSALRAAIMSGLGLASFLGRRRSSSLNAVGVGVFAIVVADPTASVSASFALSALATAGIVLFGPLLQSWACATPLRRCPPLAESLALTMAASVLSQPYACSLFNQLPLASPLANALCAPLFPATCFLGLAAVLLGWLVPPVGYALMTAGCAAGSALAAAVSVIASVPYSAVPVSVGTTFALGLSAIMAAALWVTWPVGNIRTALSVCGGAAVALLAAAVLLVPQAGDRIVMLDVGQGDAILVQSRGKAILVDTGNHDAELLSELARNGIVHLDAVLVTHADDDHCGSLDALQRAVQVDRVIVAAGLGECGDESARELLDEASKTAGEVVEVRAGDRFHVGAFTAEVVWPRTITDAGGNADSVCLMLEYDGDDDGSVDCTALMTGDAEKEQLAEMLRSGDVGRIDILKVGHHGSRNGMTEEEALALSPRVALISCGLNNRYGHPAQETLDLLDEAGARTFRTDLDGEVTCKLSPDRVTVETGG